MKKVLLCLLLTNTIFSYDQIVCITLPKSGTHLLTKCISLIQKHCNDRSKIKPCSSTHLRAWQNTKVLSIMRDPRDRLVSFVYERKFKKRDHALRTMSVAAILTGLIKDYGGFINSYIAPNTGWAQFHSLQALYDNYAKNFEPCDIYITTFENLVGPQGRSQNAKQEQIQEIIHIAAHLEIKISEKIAEKIGNELFGGTETFRAGKVGAWKNEFTQEHKDLIKKDIGHLLIKWGYETDLNW